MELLLSRIAEVTQGEVKGDMDKMIRDVAPFDTAGEDDITCASEAKYLKRLGQTNAGAVIVPKTFETSTKNIIQVDNPRLAFAKVLALFYPSAKPMSGISSNVSIGQPFSQGQEISIAPFVVIGDNVTLGHRVHLYPHVVPKAPPQRNRRLAEIGFYLPYLRMLQASPMFCGTVRGTTLA